MKNINEKELWIKYYKECFESHLRNIGFWKVFKNLDEFDNIPEPYLKRFIPKRNFKTNKKEALYYLEKLNELYKGDNLESLTVKLEKDEYLKLREKSKAYFIYSDVFSVHSYHLVNENDMIYYRTDYYVDNKLYILYKNINENTIKMLLGIKLSDFRKK